MSVGGATINVGNLQSTFVLNATAAQATINSTIQQSNVLKQAFTTNNTIKIDNRQAVQAINQTTTAANGLKKALEFGGALLGIELISKAFSAVGDAAIGTNAKIEQATTSITALTGNASVATEMVGKLETLASHSTFGLAQLTQSAQQLLAFGVAAQNVPPLLQAIQNAAAASGGDITEKLGRINYVIAELNSGIPLSARQLRQLATAGVPLDALAKQLGVTVEQLMTAGKTGTVTSQQLVNAFQQVYTSGNLGDFMQKQAGTFSGAMNLIKTNVGLAVAQAFNPLFQVISNVAVKVGQFVQTATFASWVAEARRDIGAVIEVLKTFMSVLEPVGSAIAKVFGINTTNISAEMKAVQGATIDVGKYDTSLQGAAKSTEDTKAKLGEYKKTVDDASLAIAGLNGQINSNKLLLDANAEAIQRVKNQYDPTIASATESIRKLNLLTPEELARKQRELELDRDRANLDLTKPDTSAFDSRILSDQTTLANLPRLDTSGFDTLIENARTKIEDLRSSDPAAGIKSQIAGLQDAISNLNTNEFDEKINAIKDKLAEPAPDTHGISNQLTALEAQLAGGQISQSAFDTQYGSLSKQKQDINTKYQDDTSGLKGQLKLLEQQRTDQALANRETAQADRKRIEDLKEQQKIIENGVTAQIKAQEKIVTTQTKLRTDAEQKDAKARQALQDDITKETNLRANALAPYEAALKRISDAQEQDRLKDAAAAAQRTLAIAPYKTALDEATEAKRLGLVPLDAEKQRLDDIATKLNEAKSAQTNLKQEAEANAAALKDAAANAGVLAGNLGKIPLGIGQSIAAVLGKQRSDALAGVNKFDEFGQPLADTTTSPVIKFLDGIKNWLNDNKGDIQKKLGDIGNAFTNIAHILGDILPSSIGFAKLQWELFIASLEVGKKTIEIVRDVLAGDWDKLWKDIGGATKTGTTDTLRVYDEFGKDLGDERYTHHDATETKWTAFLNSNKTSFEDTFGAESAPRRVLTGFWNFNKDGFQDVFGDESAPRHVISGFDTFMGNIFGTEGTIAKMLGKLPGLFSTMATGIGTALNGLDNLIGSPFKTAWSTVGGFFGKVSDGMGWLAKTFHISGFTGYAAGNDKGVVSPGGAADVGSFGTPALDPTRGYAAGVTNSPLPGHWGMVGEKGPEPMFVPRGATIIPNDMASAMGMLPGHADGLNLDAIGSFVKTAGGLFKAGVGAVVDRMMGGFGDPGLDGVLPGASGALLSTVKSGLLDWLKGSPDNVAQNLGSARANFGGGISGSGDLIDAIMAATSDGAERQAMLFGAFLETGGRNIAQIGGGPGAGYWQIEAGPGGQYAGLVDPYNAMAAALFMEPQYRAAMGAYNPDDLENSLARVAYGAERPAAFYDGGQIANAWDLMQPFLTAGGIKGSSPTAAGPFQGGGWPDVVQSAMGMANDPSINGPQWNNLCEKFAEMAERGAGYSEGYWDTAAAHGYGVGHNSGFGPTGSMQHWGTGYWPVYGHAAINLDGSGMVIGTSPSGIATYDMSGAADNLGWIPPGLADGGYFPGYDPHLAVIGEGPEEIAAPTDMLREIVRQESGKGGITISGPITIHASSYAEGQAAGRGLMDSLRERGRNL
jgi:tape measure domain-containing protein